MRFDSNGYFVEIEDVSVIKELDRSIIIECENEEIIIPKSQISPKSKVEFRGDNGTLVIPKWLADDRGLEGNPV